MGSRVDRSKPSTACLECRKRRAKCDRRRPHCTQCIKTSRLCTGYREQLELVMRDETHKFLPAAQSITAPITSNPNPNPTDFAIGYFTARFADGCYMDYIPNLYKAAKRSAQFEASFEAVALSYLARKEGHSSLMQTAYEKHLFALQETRQALSMPQKVVEDDAIASVMLLALFCAITKDALESRLTWTKHIHGALALLEMRTPDPDQTNRDSSYEQILSHVLGAVQLDCINRHVELPEAVQRVMKNSCWSESYYQCFFWECVRNLASLKAMSTTGQSERLNVFDRAVALEEQFCWLLKTLPQTIKHLNDSNLLLQAQNSNVRTLQRWNTLRLVRLDNILLIIDQSRHILSATIDPADRARVTKHAEKAVMTLVEIVTQICDSVPKSLYETDAGQTPPNTDVLLWGFCLPLEMCAKATSIPEDLADRVRLMLSKIMEKLNYHSADEHASLIGQQGMDQTTA